MQVSQRPLKDKCKKALTSRIKDNLSRVFIIDNLYYSNKCLLIELGQCLLNRNMNLNKIFKDAQDYYKEVVAICGKGELYIVILELPRNVKL